MKSWKHLVVRLSLIFSLCALDNSDGRQWWWCWAMYILINREFVTTGGEAQ